MNKLLTEDIVTLSEAQAVIYQATKHRPDKSTIFRWVHRGVGGTKLEAIRLGHQLFTSKQAITRFIETRSNTSIG